MSESDKWTVIKIPKDSRVFQEIEKGGRVAAWRTLEEIVQKHPKSKEEKSQELFDKFIQDMNDLYPGCEEKMLHLGPLIFRKIIHTSQIAKQNEINDEYFEMLKEW